MKKLVLCFGVLFAVVANAGLLSHAKLVGQRMHGTSLICEYAGPRATYQILAQRGSCAPFLDVQ